MDKNQFFNQYGHLLIKVNDDDAESGDYQLFVEENYIADGYRGLGYLVASIYERNDGSEYVKIDDDTTQPTNKIGFFILDTTRDNKIYLKSIK